VLTTAWLEPHHGFGPQGITLSAKADGDGFVLDGTKWHVPYAQAADGYVVLARTDAGVELFTVEASADGISTQQHKTIAADAQFAVTFDGVRVHAGSRIGAAGTGWNTWHATMLDGIVLLAAQAFALEMTVQYAKDRQQFDKPIGAFQAISHYLADASTTVEGATILVHEAAWARANDRPIDLLAPMAKLFACQTFRDVTAMGHQVHGGMGFTVECDMQMYFRRAKQLQISWWNDAYLEELIAAQTLD